MEDTNPTPYQQEGYDTRAAYLRGLADAYGMTPFEVESIADVLGETEDFDGLIAALEDFQDMTDSVYFQEFDEFTDADPGL